MSALIDARLFLCRTQVYIPKRSSTASSNSNPSRKENVDSSILVALLGNKNHQTSGISSRYSSKPSAAAGSRQQQQQQQHSNTVTPKSASISISAFPTSDMLGHDTNVLDANSERFAMKFAENFVDQQGPEQLLPFLSDAMEAPMDNPLTYLHDDCMVTASPSTGPFSGSNDCPFTENLYFGFSQLSGSPSFQSLASGSTAGSQVFGSDHVTDRFTSSSPAMSSSWRQSHDLRSPTSPTKDRKSAAAPPGGGSRLLEKFLLTKQPLNPNAGSDKAFADTKVTEKISRLHLTDPNKRAPGAQQQDGNLLKQLLTGEIDDKQYEQRVVGARRPGETDGSSPGRDGSGPGSSSTDFPIDMGFTPSDSHLGGMDLFSRGAAADMDTLFSTDVDVSTPSKGLFTLKRILSPAYVVRREGNVFSLSVCPCERKGSTLGPVHSPVGGGGVPLVLSWSIHQSCSWPCLGGGCP